MAHTTATAITKAIKVFIINFVQDTQCCFDKLAKSTNDFFTNRTAIYIGAIRPARTDVMFDIFHEIILFRFITNRCPRSRCITVKFHEPFSRFHEKFVILFQIFHKSAALIKVHQHEIGSFPLQCLPHFLL